MKIGILTITNGTNYGNKLQNYAVIKIIEKMGHGAETIRNIKNTFDSRDYKYRAKRFVKELLGKRELIDQRRKRFDAFSKKYLQESKFVISNDQHLDEIAKHYDSFLAGSDQIWNPYYEYNSEVEFMTFAPKEKRNSFAASFGIEVLNEEQISYFKPMLAEMNHISVREEKAADLVEMMIGERPFVSIDPTMMLDAVDWKEISSKPSWKNENKYLFTYFLGGMDDELNAYITRIAREKDLEVISLSGECQTAGTAISIDQFCTDPGEFVWLIANSELVLTDSFHASVFSILHQRAFGVFQRNDEKDNSNLKSNSRIQTLLSKFGLDNHQVGIHTEIDKLFYKDYANLKSVLEAERNKTYQFLAQIVK